MSILVIDVGTSGVRAAVVRQDATISFELHREVLPDSPAAGLVEFDATAMADAALEVARAVLADHGPVDGVGIANQRGSSVVWDRATGEPIGPGLGWQDLRTVGECLVLGAEGIRMAPNVSATKVAWLLDQFDPARDRDLCFGTVDSWIAWNLSGGDLHVTDMSNAGVSGLVDLAGTPTWSERVLERLRIPASMLPRIVDSTGVVGEASALPGAPPIAGIAGDQQSSLIGQGCVHRGLAKITFGTGGMLDLCLGPDRATFDVRGEGGTFPIVGWREAGELVWGLEAIMLSAGTNVEWLRDDLGIIATAAESHDVASQVDDTDGVVYVPALLGLGTPALGLRRPRGTARHHPRHRSPPRGAGRARGCRPARRRSRRGGGSRQRSRDPHPAGRRRHERQPHLRAGGGRRLGPARRGRPGARGHHPGRRLPRRPGHRRLGGLGRRGGGLAAEGHGRARATFDRDRWRDAVSRAARWHEDLSALDF